MTTKAFAVLLLLLAAAAGGASAQQGVWNIITRPMFGSMLSHRRDSRCQGAFYTYDAFIEAASKFHGFGTTGDEQTRKRELAAFFGQTSHETTGGWPAAPGGQFAWGYCRIEEDRHKTDPPYYGRGPIQLTHKYNYEDAGKALGLDLVGNPDLVSRDPVVAFKTAIWFWMTPRDGKPSCHAVMTNVWKPKPSDRAAQRFPGYGLTTNIINGGIECGPARGADAARNAMDRVGYYKRYCDMLRVGYGEHLGCKKQKPYRGG